MAKNCIKFLLKRVSKSSLENKNTIWILVFTLFFCFSCTEKSDKKLFDQIPSSKSNITFENTLNFSRDFNIYTYRNFYNGGGVGISDINNDNLPDIYFVGNQEKNRLYINEGDFKFKDITDQAGVGGSHGWSTGVSMIDVNGDGWTDIYVCNSGLVKGDNKKNELFVNNGDGTFSERAEEYGIADTGFSIHAAFFDYDRDGDLDMYLLNNSYKAIGSFDLKANQRNKRDSLGGDKLYRNDGYGFTDVSEEAGIYGSEIGFGLGVSVSDLNRDGWPDMFISNDFFERDYLYLNNRDGTFSEVLENQIKSISAASMGSDIADLDNNGYPDIFVTDMLPDDEKRLKTVTTFENWQKYQFKLKNDYYHQYTRNMLHYNNGDSTFSEIGRYSGVAASDWSWGALIADFDMDGLQDIFVANGIYQDLTNLDYLTHITQEDVVKSIVKGNNVDYEKLIDLIPSNPISNFAFRNTGDLQFANSAKEWGLSQPGFSNGSAYGDLDNDGDLDLVVNNVNMKPFVYRNQSVEAKTGNNWLQLKLQGSPSNTEAIAAQAIVKADGKSWWREQMPVRGYQSTVDDRLHFGLGDVQKIDTLMVQWPDGSTTLRTDVAVNQSLALSLDSASDIAKESHKKSTKPLLKKIDDTLGINWKHEESNYNDFAKSPLLKHMRSTQGPAACSGDLNGDGLEDLYLGGAKGQSGSVWMQTNTGKFKQHISSVITADDASEDTDCVIFDANGNGRGDLYVASGSSEFPSSSDALIDRLYFSNSDGSFSPSAQLLPTPGFEPTGTVNAADYDGDGDTDLFVGIRLKPNAVGVSVNGYLLANDGSGNFENVTEKVAPALGRLGMITSAAWGDIDLDGDPDLIVAGEWMPLTIFINENGNLNKSTKAAGLNATKGLWNTVKLADMDEDGDLDIIAGNQGKNSLLKASEEQPLSMWVGDFDQNGSLEQFLATFDGDTAYPVALRHQIIDQLPRMKLRYPDYKSYAGKSVQNIFTQKQRERAIQLAANNSHSVIGWNNGNGKFSIQKLPMKAQWTPIYGILATDLNGDGKKDLLTGGNLWNAAPQVGRYDAGYGLVLKQLADKSFESLSSMESGFKIDGQVRKIIALNMKSGSYKILVIRNNGSPVFFQPANIKP